MVKILYGVYGEGMGHAIRSKVVLDHISKKHDVIIVSSGRPYEFLKNHFDNVHRIHYAHIVYKDNAVSHFRTLFTNITKGISGIPTATVKLLKIFHKEKPDVVITDFEPFSDTISKLFRVPVIAIDNINILVKGEIDWKKKDILDYLLARTIARTYVKGAKKYILSTFFHPKMVKPEKTVYIPPILRPEILNTKPNIGSHILVYQTSKSNKTLPRILKRSHHKFIVYGFDISKKEGHVEFKKFDEVGFIKDLASSKAVIANGGFTVLGEALYLKKPVMSIPVRRQYEQMMNAQYIEKLGYGMYVKELNCVRLRDFISSISKYKKNLEDYNQTDNRQLFKEIDSTIKGLTSKIN